MTIQRSRRSRLAGDLCRDAAHAGGVESGRFRIEADIAPIFEYTGLGGPETTWAGQGDLARLGFSGGRAGCAC